MKTNVALLISILFLGKEWSASAQTACQQYCGAGTNCKSALDVSEPLGAVSESTISFVKLPPHPAPTPGVQCTPCGAPGEPVCNQNSPTPGCFPGASPNTDNYYSSSATCETCTSGCLTEPVCSPTCAQAWTDCSPGVHIMKINQPPTCVSCGGLGELPCDLTGPNQGCSTSGGAQLAIDPASNLCSCPVVPGNNVQLAVENGACSCPQNYTLDPITKYCVPCGTPGSLVCPGESACEGPNIAPDSLTSLCECVQGSAWMNGACEPEQVSLSVPETVTPNNFSYGIAATLTYAPATSTVTINMNRNAKYNDPCNVTDGADLAATCWFGSANQPYIAGISFYEQWDCNMFEESGTSGTGSLTETVSMTDWVTLVNGPQVMCVVTQTDEGGSSYDLCQSCCISAVGPQGVACETLGCTCGVYSQCDNDPASCDLCSSDPGACTPIDPTDDGLRLVHLPGH